jgi:RNA polymerase sigma factor (sigma-70 family)
VNEIYGLLGSKAFLKSLYAFAYKRTANSYEAEDLCSDIVAAVLSAARRNSDVTHPYAFVWTIARRVYADFSVKRKRGASHTTLYSDNAATGCSQPIDEYVENEDDKLRLRRILREFAFLSKIYRDVCVMYYLDELKVPHIAKRLGISQNTVKQRLHTARITIRKGVKNMDKMDNLTLKPIGMAYIGTGSPTGNDPCGLAHRGLSKALLYLCKDTPRSAKELSDLLGVPMFYIEEEIWIQTKGVNGYYGLLRETENGKYISNFIILDYADYMKVNALYRRHADAIAEKFHAFVKENEQTLLDLPFLNKQTDTRLITWRLIHDLNWDLITNVGKKLEEKHLTHITPTQRDFYTFGIAYKEEDDFDTGFYGCDGNTAHDIDGYKRVFYSNVYGRRLEKHFGCGHDLSQEKPLRLTLRAIGGLPLSSLTEDERETAAKAIEAGYIKKENSTLHPRILVIENDGAYWRVADDFNSQIAHLIEPMADDIHKMIKKYLPKHMMGEYKIFNQQTSCGLLDGMYEKCIELGTINAPEKTPSAEGVFMVVTRK